MSSSLDKLVSNLPNDAFKYTSEETKNDRKLKLMKQKGVYPYDYLDSFNSLSIYMQSKYGIHLNYRIRENTMTKVRRSFISRWIRKL